MKKLFLSSFFMVLAIMLSAQFSKSNHVAYDDGNMIKIITTTDAPYYEPLTDIKMNVTGKGIVSVYDSYGNEYFSTTVSGGEISFKAGGALGGQQICLKDSKGKLLDKANIQVNCKTELSDEKGEFSELMNMLFNSMMRSNGGGGQHLYKNKIYKTYDGWFQDNVHTFKGMKYFDEQVKDYVDLFADGQKENGMIYDNYYQEYKSYESWFDRFGPEFVAKGPSNQNSSFWCRIPIENEPEFSFLEAVYFVWKATGDDEWMKKRLENCIKAINYTRTDPYRWSEKFQLTKRGYTIDIWDFQCDEDAALYRLNDIMMAQLGVTRYGVSYADNIGMAIGCEYVSEMLEYSGRKEDAAKYMTMAKEWRAQTDKVCWNGKFYTHWVPEDPTVKRDFGGTDESKQVSLSNTYCLNRRMPHDKAVEIIKTYQRIKEEMPKSSPGEWYLLYPPYEKGWHLEKWEYMNGGVSPIVAGELAKGAYEHGYEYYASDILRRVWELSQRSGNYLYDTYKGSLPEKPIRKFTSVNMKEAVNADFDGETKTKGVLGWSSENPANNDMINFPTGKQIFHDIEFEILNPATNGGKASLILSGDKRYPRTKMIAINSKAASVYLVHAKSGPSQSPGYIKLHYTDGTFYRQNIIDGKQVAGWWYPNDVGQCKVAWKGPNRFCKSVGMYLWGFNNPNPDKTIKSIEFTSDEDNTKWMINGISLCDYKVWYDPGIISYGIPSDWADAAVIYALVEGLAGVKDIGVAYNKALLAPRWESAGIREAKANIKYEASQGYVSYRYKYDVASKQLNVLFTGSGIETQVELLLPKGTVVTEVINNGSPVQYSIKKIESSEYATFNVSKSGVNNILMKLK